MSDNAVLVAYYAFAVLVVMICTAASVYTGNMGYLWLLLLLLFCPSSTKGNEEKNE